MRRFLLRRLVQGVITLFVLSTIVFVLARLTGDPTDLLVPMDATPEAISAVKHELGLDKPYYVQYWVFVSRAVRGDFGDSVRLKRPAMKMVMDRLPNSIKLGAVAMVFALLASFPLGVMSAVKRGKWVDHVARFVAVAGMTAPPFLVGILIMQLFSVKLGWLPSAGMRGPESYIMPGFTLGLFALASMTRLLRSSMLEVLDSEFIKLVRLKGASERIVIWKHAVRNSIMPVLTMGGMYFALMVTVAVVVETVFNWPGIGTLSYSAIIGRDFPVIQAVVIVAAALVILVNLLVDIAYAFLDPRIRHV